MPFYARCHSPLKVNAFVSRGLDSRKTHVFSPESMKVGIRALGGFGHEVGTGKAVGGRSLGTLLTPSGTHGGPARTGRGLCLRSCSFHSLRDASYCHLMGKETKVQRGCVVRPRSHNQQLSTGREVQKKS